MKLKEFVSSISPWHFLCCLTALDCILSLCIVQWVPYTEIDWKAYMQEVEGYLGGEMNYSLLKGI